MKKQQGFTLIELVMVIVILGILAATALPKFVSLQKDAKVASLKGMKASLQTAMQIAHAKALIQGVNPTASMVWVDMNNNGTKTLADGDVLVIYLYPAALPAVLANTVEFDGFTLDGGEFRLNGVDGCELTYNHPTAIGASPTYTLTTTVC